MDSVPRSEQFDDVYFSVQDGLAETRHVFLDGNDLPNAWQGRGEFTICETGFGTGLNFLAVLSLLKDNPVKLHYSSIEKYPLGKEEIKEHLSVWPELAAELDMMLSVYPEGGQIGDVTLELHFSDVNMAMPRLDQKVDCWFLDGFKPSSNPDMWTDNVFQNMARLSKEGSTFATFTSAGFVRRGLEEVGFDVRKVPGFGHKREMSVGTFKGRAYED